ncbi:MAG: thiopurine S-methyltransferase [Hydrogenovibrio sp.]
MKAEFWHSKWENNEIGFHQPDVNAYLAQYWSCLGLQGDETVLVPLCGKSQDMVWLHRRGHSVLGVELSEKALADFLLENDLDARTAEHHQFCGYELQDMTLFCGDFFHLSAVDCRAVKAVYDRAALIALPLEGRRRYAAHLRDILPPDVPIMLIGLDYEQAKRQGPPFAVPDEEVRDLFGDDYDIDILATASFERKGVFTLETAYRLLPKSSAMGGNI